MNAATMRMGLWLALFTFGAVGCNWRSDGLARLQDLYPPPDIPEEEVFIPDVQLGEIAGDGLAGSWIMRMRLPGTMKIFKDPSDLLLTNLFLVEIAAKEESARLTFCQQVVELDALGLGDTELSEAARLALGETPVELLLDGDEGLAAQQVAWTWGLQDMADPVGDELPTDAGDPRVWDQDQDENPGVTLHVLEPEGDRYMVRRAVWNLAAATLSENGQWLETTLTFTIDENALGYAGSPDLETVIPIVPSQEGGTARLRRVPDEGESSYTCDRLVTEHLGIFGP